RASEQSRVVIEFDEEPLVFFGEKHAAMRSLASNTSTVTTTNNRSFPLRAPIYSFLSKNAEFDTYSEGYSAICNKRTHLATTRAREQKTKARRKSRGLCEVMAGIDRDSLLPRAFLVAVGFQAFSPLVLVHLQTTFLFQITHGE